MKVKYTDEDVQHQKDFLRTDKYNPTMDVFGNKLEVGDRVVRLITSVRCIGEVVEIVDHRPTCGGRHPEVTQIIKVAPVVLGEVSKKQQWTWGGCLMRITDDLVDNLKKYEQSEQLEMEY